MRPFPSKFFRPAHLLPILAGAYGENMTLQNRVLATGEIVAHPARGMFMGNRGILHDAGKTLGRARWKHKAWIICALVWKDWHREVMQPNAYTELFFLDEAVALAAGHRPCKLCRRRAFEAYCAAAGHVGSAPDLDAALHHERAIPRTFTQRRHEARAPDLPNGAIILEGERATLLWEDAQFAITPSGYASPAPRTTRETVTVLTPPKSLAALRGGYAPRLHPSAAGLIL